MTKEAKGRSKSARGSGRIKSVALAALTCAGVIAGTEASARADVCVHRATNVRAVVYGDGAKYDGSKQEGGAGQRAGASRRDGARLGARST